MRQGVRLFLQSTRTYVRKAVEMVCVVWVIQLLPAAVFQRHTVASAGFLGSSLLRAEVTIPLAAFFLWVADFGMRRLASQPRMEDSTGSERPPESSVVERGNKE